MKAHQFTPQDLEELFGIAASCELVLVGGQAVACWARLLEKPDLEPWKSKRPYTSRDADAIGSKTQMLEFARTLRNLGWKVEIFLPEGDEIAINTGALRIHGQFPNQADSIEMNFLKHLQGQTYQTIRQQAILIPINKREALVIGPLRLLESKTISLNTLDQNGRQDKSHLQLCVAITREMLATAGKSPLWPAALDNANEIIGMAKQEFGINSLRFHQIDLLEAIPWEFWRSSRQSELAEFAGSESLHRSEVRDLINKDVEIEDWLQQLNPNPHKSKKSRTIDGNPADPT